MRATAAKKKTENERTNSEIETAMDFLLRCRPLASPRKITQVSAWMPEVFEDPDGLL